MISGVLHWDSSRKLIECAGGSEAMGERPRALNKRRGGSYDEPPRQVTSPINYIEIASELPTSRVAFEPV